MLKITEEFLDQEIERIKQKHPKFAIEFKDRVWHQKIIGKVLSPFNDSYMTRYATAMFGKIYVYRGFWDNPTNAYVTLRHEEKHLDDEKKFSILYHFSYLFFLPVVFTMRALWEFRALKETFRAIYQIAGALPDLLIDKYIKYFVNSSYLWMFPFRSYVKKKLTNIAKEVIQEEG